MSEFCIFSNHRFPNCLFVKHVFPNCMHRPMLYVFHALHHICSTYNVYVPRCFVVQRPHFMCYIVFCLCRVLRHIFRLVCRGFTNHAMICIIFASAWLVGAPPSGFAPGLSSLDVGGLDFDSLDDAVLGNLLLDAAGTEQNETELMVLDGESGGLSHIKVSPAHAHESAFAASVADHAVSEQLKAQERRGLQEALDQAEPGAALNVSTPEDGHCLFLSLKSGGIFASRPDFNDLDIADFRQEVLSEATNEQREAAAVSNDLPVSVWEQ